ncbi:MAG: RuBisCO large subunit C-terminal-like domain-containing protein [Candidatus Micrarchaeota archaeon]|nr:RuBisCO large subunit C-terminal-like domain-containing protein [Candidatus Micrarchaeota archaeon]
MVYGGYSYVDYKYVPDKDNDFVVLFWAKGSMSIEKIAEAIAAESSVGSWTKLKTMNDFVWKHYRARVFWIGKVDSKSGFIKIAYPIEHFDSKNISQFMASVLGNIFGLKELEELYVFDVSFPIRFQKQFSGPVHGLDGIRKMAGTLKSRRPHVGTIVKPKVGLTAKEWAHVAYESYAGGIDLVKDDENLVDQDFCKWKDRLHETVKAIEKAGNETNQNHLYSSNVTDRYSRMVERVDYLNEMGLQKNVLVMLDVYILGMSALEDILELTKKYKFATHGHRAGYAAANRGNFGINFQVYEKFYRLLGIDQLHIGTGVGKMEGAPVMIRRLHNIADQFKLDEKPYLGSLAMEFAPGINPMLSIASGGLNAGMVDAVVALMGKDTNLQAGAGVHGHPGGTRKGAMSMRQAIDAVMKGVPAPEYAKTHPELAQALKTWRYVSPRSIIKELEFVEKNAAKLSATALKKGRWKMQVLNEQ